MATLRDSHNTGDDGDNGFYGANVWVGQTFTASASYSITSVKLKLYRLGSPGTITVSIRATSSGLPTGNDLCVGTTDGDTLTTSSSGEWREITFGSAYTLTSGTVYAICVRALNGAIPNIAYWRIETVGSYSNGQSCNYNGSIWAQGANDYMFETYDLFTVTSDISTVRKLVAAANNEIWYEDSAGSMTELTAANGDIDTTDQLVMFELLQKVFIVNGSKLKVADFINHKIVDANGFTNKPAHGDLVYQNGASPATIVVDYIDSASNVLYGYVASGTLETTTAITTASGGGGNVILPSPDSVTAAPHWYDWTVYDKDTSTYGTMPTKVYAGCNYRGRAKLALDPKYPYQWYMSRQFNPWDWLYVANDAQSPVKGGDADAGEIGDIVRAIIPYRDDYCIHGCATSMWYMAGDPAFGGTINELDLTVGMFGTTSGCFDGQGNFYFWGDGGLYKTKVPGKPECISGIRLPSLVKDEAADPSTHRISMAYDRTRIGILICITRLSDGVNSSYWYDLQTGGFFPESYASNCSPFSALFYAANDSDYKELLVGCKDGYIRKFNESLKSDNATADAVGVGTNAIDSYVGIGPIQINESSRKQGKINNIEFVSAGGASGGSESDSNDVDCKVWVSESAERIAEKLSAGTNPNLSKTIKAPGRQRGQTIKNKLKGVYAGIELRNNTVDESWGFEQLLIDAKPAGKVR